MIIKGILVGTCIINDLHDLRISSGQFCDLKDAYSREEIQASLKPPNGSLYIAISTGLVDRISRESMEYKGWREKLSREEKEELRRKSRRPVSMEMTEYWKMNKAQRKGYIQGLTDRDFAVLERARDHEEDIEILNMLNEKLGFYKEIRLPSGFVLFQ